MSQFIKTEVDILTSAELSEVQVNRSSLKVDKLRDTEITFIFDKWLNDEPFLSAQSAHYKVEVEITLSQAKALVEQLSKAVIVGERLTDTNTHGMVIAYSSSGFDELNLKPMADCNTCAGTGTKPVSDGDTFYSGDDPCECALDEALV